MCFPAGYIYNLTFGFCHLHLSGSRNGCRSVCQQSLRGNSCQTWWVWQVRCLQEVPKHLQSSQSMMTFFIPYDLHSFHSSCVTINHKSASVFLSPKERNDVEIEKVKSTLILCYGQVALNAPSEKILNHIDKDILRSISKHFNTKVIQHRHAQDYVIRALWLAILYTVL